MSRRRGTGKKPVTYYIHYGIFFSHKEEQNYDIFRKLDTIGDNCIKLIKSVSEK